MVKRNDTIESVTARLLAQAEELVGDGKVTAAEAWTFLHVAAGDLVTVARGYLLAGEQKKARVVAALVTIYTRVLRPLLVASLTPRLPSWLTAWLFAPALDLFVQGVLIPGMVDGAYTLLTDARP